MKIAVKERQRTAAKTLRAVCESLAKIIRGFDQAGPEAGVPGEIKTKGDHKEMKI
jgi:hypothetical protein